MFSSSAIRSINIFCQARGLSSCLVLNSSKVASSKSSISHVYRVMNVKKGTKKKSKKKHIVVKRTSEDIEAVWLENLDSNNIKLFRRTSFGTFRKINKMDILLEKLKQIYPGVFGRVDSIEQSSDKENCPPAKSQPDSESDSMKGSLCLSEYLIKNIMEFPLLRSKTESSFCKYAQQEVEEYGAVDAVMFPSVTAILNETMSYVARLRLKQWKERMIAELGQEGFYKYQEDLLAQGSKFHSTLKTYLEVPDKTLVKVDPQIEGCWKSVEKLLADISDVQFVEESIYHPILLYKGIVDCVAAYRGTPCVIEWKKSGKPKPDLQSTYDAPLQVCAYLGALPWHKNVTIERALVVVAYTDGTPANIFHLGPDSCQTYWTEWLRRVQSYWLKKSSMIVKEEAQM